MWNLTNGTVHATDVTNASCTMLVNIETLRWDEGLLRELDIPQAMLPEVRASSEGYGHAGGNLFRGESIPIAGVAGDQQAALFGQACFRPGMAKNTYGTGAFVLMNTGARRAPSREGLITTVAWDLGEEVTYALEGSIFSTGATVQWLRDGLQIIGETSEVEALAASVPDNGDVYLVPAFAGLGAPYWDMYARGAIVGLTRGATRAHIARAALESIAYRTRDVVDAMISDAGLEVPALRVDGGGTANDFLMQFQADILGIPIERSAVAETTALGTAYLAGLAVGFWEGPEEIAGQWASDRSFPRWARRGGRPCTGSGSGPWSGPRGGGRARSRGRNAAFRGSQMEPASPYILRIQERFPDLGFRTLDLNQDGLLNDVVVVNNERVFRFPKADWARDWLLKEERILNLVRRYVDMRVPALELIDGEFATYEYIPGDPLQRNDILGLVEIEQEHIAEQFASFLRQLHAIPKDELVSCIRSSLHYSKVSEKIGNRILARTGETD